MALSSSYVSIIAKTRKRPQGVLLGWVENFSINEQHIAELLRTVGRPLPKENIYHGKGGVSISWEGFYEADSQELVTQGITPGELELSAHEPIDVIYLHYKSGTVLGEAQRVLPNSVGINAGAQSTIRQSFSGEGINFIHASELAG